MYVVLNPVFSANCSCVSPAFFRNRLMLRASPRSRFGVIVTVGVLLYATFNVWVYQYSSGNAPSPKALWQTVTKSTTSFPGLTGLNPVKKQGSTLPESSSPPPTLTPTPRPTGPGSYACSPEGTCNLYGDAVRTQYCTKTYADSLCLDQCKDKSKQCTK